MFSHRCGPKLPPRPRTRLRGYAAHRSIRRVAKARSAPAARSPTAAATACSVTPSGRMQYRRCVPCAFYCPRDDVKHVAGRNGTHLAGEKREFRAAPVRVRGLCTATLHSLPRRVPTRRLLLALSWPPAARCTRQGGRGACAAGHFTCVTRHKSCGLMGAVEGVSSQQGVACDSSFDRGAQQMRGQRHWQYERRFYEQALLQHAAVAARDHAPSPLFVRRSELQHRIRLQATDASRALRQRSPCGRRRTWPSFQRLTPRSGQPSRNRPVRVCVTWAAQEC